MGGLPVWQRRLLVAGGAGAGFAAIYNVPLGGALLALEVMLGTLALPLVLPALLMSLTATAVAWIFLGDKPIYHVLPDHFRVSQLVFAILMGPIIGLVAVGWTRLITFATQLRPKGIGRWYVPFLAFGAVGLLSLQYPQLLGNGRAIVQLAILGNISLGPAGDAADPEAAGHRPVSHDRIAGRSVHADVRGGRAAVGRRRSALGARVARLGPWLLRADRRRRLPGGRDAGAAVRRGARARAHASPRPADGADPGRRGRGDVVSRRLGGVLDLLSAAGLRRGHGLEPDRQRGFCRDDLRA